MFPKVIYRQYMLKTTKKTTNKHHHPPKQHISQIQKSAPLELCCAQLLTIDNEDLRSVKPVKALKSRFARKPEKARIGRHLKSKSMQRSFRRFHEGQFVCKHQQSRAETKKIDISLVSTK